MNKVNMYIYTIYIYSVILATIVFSMDINVYKNQLKLKLFKSAKLVTPPTN